MSGYHLGKLVAPFTWIGSCNLQVLIAWLTEMLLPTIGAGKKIVLDNASFHRCKLVRKVVETAGCELIYLPKYSHFGLKCDTNLRNNYESLHQWWCQGERTSSIFLMR
jgi:hypothetical protein